MSSLERRQIAVEVALSNWLVEVLDRLRQRQREDQALPPIAKAAREGIVKIIRLLDQGPKDLAQD